MPDRSFYGGDAPAGGDNISGGVYQGPGLGDGPWKCPACKTEQSGPLSEGCQSCGSGSAKAFSLGQPSVRLPRPDSGGPLRDMNAEKIAQLRRTMDAGLDLYSYAAAWAAANADATLADAFVAGFQHANAKTLGAPPVAVDVPRLAPEGKPRRTIVAALQFFREQVLPRALEEVSSGEWCSIEEVGELIRQLTDEETTA